MGKLENSPRVPGRGKSRGQDQGSPEEQDDAGEDDEVVEVVVGVDDEGAAEVGPCQGSAFLDSVSFFVFAASRAEERRKDM